MTLRIGIIGDLHAYWDEMDVAQIDECGYDLVFFLGDLGGGTRNSTLRIARLISGLNTKTLVLPGNHDTWELGEIAAELAHRRGIRLITDIHRGASHSEKDVALCGYSVHRLTSQTVDVSLLVGRPHSLGGPELAFPEYMQETYGVDTMQASTDKLCSLVEGLESSDVIFLAHNGPLGLGGEANDMWGCDFRPDGGDWGDPDLTQAISHARRQGHRVLGVVAGHMHLKTKGGDERPWKKLVDDTQFVNAAKVPRIYTEAGQPVRHHVELILDEDGLTFVERLLG